MYVDNVGDNNNNNVLVREEYPCNNILKCKSIAMLISLFLSEATHVICIIITVHYAIT